MTRPVAACPNCSAPVEFRWSSAVQTVCGHCRSVVVRHDVDLKAVGVVADLPLSGSPIRSARAAGFKATPSRSPAASSTSTSTAPGTSGMSCLPTTAAAGCRTRRRNTPSHASSQKPASLPAAADWRSARRTPSATVVPAHDVDAREVPGRRRRAALRVLGQRRGAVRGPAVRRRPLRHDRLQRDAAAAVHRRVRRRSTSSSSRICGADEGPR